MLFYDFYFFYAVGLLLLNGGNPYDLEQYQSTLISIGYPLDKVVVPFPYPPWSLYFFYILGSLPFTGSLIALLFVSIVGSLKALLNSLDTVSIKPPWMSPTKALFFFYSIRATYLRNLLRSTQLDSFYQRTRGASIFVAGKIASCGIFFFYHVNKTTSLVRSVWFFIGRNYTSSKNQTTHWITPRCPPSRRAFLHTFPFRFSVYSDTSL